MACTSCGASILPDSNYCPRCSAPVQRIKSPTRKSPARERTVKFEEKSLVGQLLSHMLPGGRIGREVFAVTVLTIVGGFYAVLFLGGLVYYRYNPLARNDALDGAVVTSVWLILLPLVLFQLIKRLHDFGRTAMALLFFLIPFWNWVEVFKAFFAEGKSDWADPLGQPYPSVPYGTDSTTFKGLRRVLGWAVAASLVVAVFAIFVAIPPSVGPTTSGAISPGDYLTTNDLHFDDCFNFVDELNDEINIVPCSGSWQYRVLGSFNSTLSTYPGPAHFRVLASSRCASTVSQILYPTSETWDLGDRTTICLEQRAGSGQ